MSLEALLKITLIGSTFISGYIAGSNSSSETKRKFNEMLSFPSQMFSSLIDASSNNTSNSPFEERRRFNNFNKPDLFDEISKFFEQSGLVRKFVIGVVGVCSLIGSAMVVSDLLDMFTEMANRPQLLRQQNNGGDRPRNNNNNNQEHGPRINRDFVDRMEFFGARQPPVHYQPQPIREDQAGTVPCCIVCLANARDTVCEPCGHLVMDWNCAMAMVEHTEENENRPTVECPVCRQRAEAFSFVMIA